MVVFLMIPGAVLAQEAASLPGSREILELRSDDARCPDGYRCFIAGRSASYEQMLERVNSDIEDASSHITLAQFEAANPCRLIYHRTDGAWRRNGSCPTQNRTSAPVSWSRFCSAGTCRRWTIATVDAGHPTIYRVPASRQLTPGERAEEMVRMLDSSEIEETVPAPAQLGAELTELAELMGETQPPTYRQTQSVIRSMGQTLTRASDAVASDEVRQHPIRQPVSAQATSAPEETPAASAEAVDQSHTASVDESTSSPVFSVLLLLLFGLMLGGGILAHLYRKAKIERDAARKEVKRLELKLQHVEHDNSLRVAWRDADMPGEPTPAHIVQMARSHATIVRAMSREDGWSPAYGDIHEHLGEVLAEVGAARVVQRVLQEALPSGTDIHSATALSKELTDLKRSARQIQELREKNQSLAIAHDLIYEAAQTSAQRCEALEAEMRAMKLAKPADEDMAEANELLAISRTAWMHFETVLDIFDQYDLVQIDGRVRSFGKKSHEVDQILSAIYGALMVLQRDITELRDKAFVGSTGRDIATIAISDPLLSESSPPLDDARIEEGELPRELSRISTSPFSLVDENARTVIRAASGIGKPRNGQLSKFPETIRPGPGSGDGWSDDEP